MIRLLVILMLVGTTVAGRAENTLEVGVAEFTAAYQSWDGTGLVKAAQTLAAATESSTNQYWRGVVEFHRLLWLAGETNRTETAKALEVTIATLQRAVQLDPQNGENRALLSATYGLSIGASPARGFWLGKRLMDQEKLARKYSPENPRVLYLAGINRFYGPGLLGGKNEGLKLLLAAEELFEAEAGKPAGLAEPRWGRGACRVYIGKTYDALGKSAEAEEYFRKALQLNPADKLAQGELEKLKK